MIEGLKILIMRVMIAMLIIVGLIPLYRFVYAFVSAMNLTYAAGSLSTINAGVNMIYPIMFFGIGVAVFHIYYRAVQKRQYESTYQETQYYDPYTRQ